MRQAIRERVEKEELKNMKRNIETDKKAVDEINSILRPAEGNTTKEFSNNIVIM